MAGVAFLDLMTARTLGGLKRQLLALCEANGLPVTSWVPGDPTERWVDITPRLAFAVISGIQTQAVRGFFLEFATDPGDAGDLSADQAPRAGFLSALGEGWYATTRRGSTFATTTCTIRNDGTADFTFRPFDLNFTRTGTPLADGGLPTYRNSSDPAVYTGAGGTLTIAPGGSATISIAADQIGTDGNAPVNTIVYVGGTIAGTLTVTASALAIGQGRETADSYRARCKLNAASLAPGGPQQAYLRAATTAKDGTPLQRHDGTGPVGITKVYASRDSSTGTVLVFYADADGGADAVDVQSASVNSLGIVLGSITSPTGIVPDGVTFGSGTSTYGGALPSGTPIGAAASEVTINVNAAYKIKSRAGISDAALKAAAEAAITGTAWPAYFAAAPIGGLDQTAGAGVIPTADLLVAGAAAYPGLHAGTITTPGTSTTAIGVGEVAKLGTPTATVTVVP